MSHISRSILIFSVLTFISAGCRERTLSWSCYNPKRIQEAKSLVLIDRPMEKSGMPYPTLISQVASQLIALGWRVMILPEGIQIIQPSFTPTTQPSTKSLDTQRHLLVPEDNLARAKQAGADLLTELTVHAIFDVNMRTDSSPYWTYGVYRGYRYGLWGVEGGPYPLLEGSDEMDVSWFWKLRSLSLRITDVTDGTVLAVISVRYTEGQGHFADVVKDLLMGLEAIRKGQSIGEVKLNTKPGEW